MIPPALTVEEVEIVIQINGKVRGRMKVPAGSAEEKLLEKAREQQRIGELLEEEEGGAPYRCAR